MNRLCLLIACLVLFLAAGLPSDVQGDEPPSRFWLVETINAGLPPAPWSINLETPQATMETFLVAGKAGNWDTAAHTLDLSNVPKAEQAMRGPKLAEHLYQVIQRAVWLDWSDFPDRPDAIFENRSTKVATAGEPRRSLKVAIVKLPDRPVTIRLSRLKAEGGEPVWLFSAQTVDNVMAMYQVYGPRDFERALPPWLRAESLLNLMTWELIALPVLLLGALLAGLVAHRLVGWVQDRQPTRLLTRLFRAMRMPAALLAVTSVFFAVETYLFTFSGATNAILAPIQIGVTITALMLIAVKAVDAVLDRVARRNIDELSDPETAEERQLFTTISGIRRVAIAVAIVCGTAIVLSQTSAFQTLGFTLLASAGLFGLVFVFAARTLLSDVMASLQIAFSQVARIGDAVLFKGDWCYVEKIQFTHLQLRSWDHRRLMVPVSEFVSETFENWSKQNPKLVKPVELVLDFRADIDRLREAFEEIVAQDEDIIEKEKAKVQVVGQDASGIIVRFYVMASDPVTAWDMHCRVREALLRRIVALEAEGTAEETGQAVYLPREREGVFQEGVAA